MAFWEIPVFRRGKRREPTLRVERCVEVRIISYHCRLLTSVPERGSWASSLLRRFAFTEIYWLAFHVRIPAQLFFQRYGD